MPVNAYCYNGVIRYDEAGTIDLLSVMLGENANDIVKLDPHLARNGILIIRIWFAIR